MIKIKALKILQRHLVAGVGFEPHDLRVMSPTSYRLLYPAILDCKYTDIF